MRIILAVQVFFKVLVDRQFAERVRQSLTRKMEAPSATDLTPRPPVEPPRPPAQQPARSDAISLLATLQREARFIDIVMEPLGNYTDAQIGAATRDVLRDCGKVIQRLFDLHPVLDAAEGSEYQTPVDVDAGRFRLAGNVAGDPPYRGRIVHHGWQAKRCELPQWSGSRETSLIVAPAELEI